MSRRPILGLMPTLLLVPMLATRAAAAAQQARTQAANSQPKPNDAVIHDFVFGDGENLASLKLHYLTLGKPRRDASGAITNGVLLLHGTAGSSADLVTPGFFAALYGAGEPLDLGRWNQHRSVVRCRRHVQELRRVGQVVGKIDGEHRFIDQAQIWGRIISAER